MGICPTHPKTKILTKTSEYQVIGQLRTLCIQYNIKTTFLILSILFIHYVFPGRGNDGNLRAPQSKSLGDLSVYDNYIPPHMKVSPIVARNLHVNGRDDLLSSDNESYPDYHVLEGPDPNATS